jgi:hypothetical protein
LTTANDLAEPVTFPMGPIATPAERNLLLSQRAKEANIQILTEKSQKRRKTNFKTKNTSMSTSSTSKTNTESSKDMENRSTTSRKRKICKLDSSENESSEDESSSSSEENESEKSEKINGSDDSSGSEDSEYDIDKFAYLRNTLHYDEDDKTIYKTTRVVEENGYIVVYRKKKYCNGKFAAKEEKSPIYAKDVVEYTKEYDRMNK